MQLIYHHEVLTHVDPGCERKALQSTRSVSAILKGARRVFVLRDHMGAVERMLELFGISNLDLTVVHKMHELASDGAVFFSPRRGEEADYSFWVLKWRKKEARER